MTHAGLHKKTPRRNFEKNVRKFEIKIRIFENLLVV